MGYFGKLQGRFRSEVTDPKLNPDDAVRPLPLLIEKILGASEQLPESWPVDGTTGYDLGAALLGLWIDPAGEETLSAVHRDFTGERRPYGAIVHECKLRTLESMASEVNMLARLLSRIASENRNWSDFTLIALTHALRETLASFPVYRTYVRADDGVSDKDARLIKTAIRAARLRSATLDPSVFVFLEQVLLGRASDSEPERAAMTHFTMRFQQLSGPIMAKAVEDTAFYRYNRLLCLNEVGGDPGRFGTSIERFQAQNRERARSWPLAMSALSTHDSKRGEDASARIAVLSEIPTEWRQVVARWSRKTEPHKRPVGDAGAAAPARRDEYTFYQALVGAWPFGWDGKQGRDDLRARLVAFMQKAAREAKLETSWNRPDEDYEAGLRAFVEGALSDDGFMVDVAQWSERIDIAGATNALAQTVLKLCAPGVPDTFQGCELWSQSLVDPDNRRPVDFAARRTMLSRIMARSDDPAGLSRELLATWQDGALKLYVTHAALRTRARLPEVFRAGDYEPVDGGEHVVAFARTLAERRVIVLVPRLTLSLVNSAGRWATGDVWHDATVELRHGVYRDVLTGRRHQAGPTLRLADIFADLPVALLVDDGAP
jgi:(1->4)-alpha-D-glucan 1-alpha-D-glucosylmutase